MLHLFLAPKAFEAVMDRVFLPEIAEQIGAPQDWTCTCIVTVVAAKVQFTCNSPCAPVQNESLYH